MPTRDPPKQLIHSRGNRAFSSYASKLWNSQPADIRDANSLDILKTSLKNFQETFYLISFLLCCSLLSAFPYLSVTTSYVYANENYHN